MTDFDVFNGDADGLCALQQLRLAEPRESRLITGVKRDIALLQQVNAGPGDRVTVLDISLDKNRDDLERLLSAGAEVRYFDHHYAGEIPAAANLEAHIDTSPEICTSLLVNAWLDGRFRLWAVAGAYGDNFDEQARQLAAQAGLPGNDTERLKRLGILLNYNGYGATVDDLFFAPDALFRALHPYADPREFVASEAIYARLNEGFDEDMERIRSVVPEVEESAIAVYLLPDAPWSRRASGVFGNELAREEPERAHAIVTDMGDGTYRISVRAPLARRTGADELCRSFQSGGGRAAAAGINALPQAQFGEFIDRFRSQYT